MSEARYCHSGLPSHVPRNGSNRSRPKVSRSRRSAVNWVSRFAAGVGRTGALVTATLVFVLVCAPSQCGRVRKSTIHRAADMPRNFHFEIMR